MVDKTYTERTGGRYIRDPQTGRRSRVDAATPEPADPAPASGANETADSRKGKKS